MSRRPLFCLIAIAVILVPFVFLAAQERGAPKSGGGAGQPDDVPIVQRVMRARKEYQDSLMSLREHYLKGADQERTKWVEEELLSYHRISKRAYRLDLDVPPPTLQPIHNQQEANDLFRQAMSYKGKGWFTEHDDNLRRAELLFQQLLTNYPQSNKISITAYQLGEIYESRTFKQYRRSAQYFERCFQWDTNTTTDSRLRAARLYDRTLQERGRAIQLYRDVASSDHDQKRVEEAKKRLAELSATPP